MADPVRDAALRGDSAFLAGWFSARWMLDVRPEDVDRWLKPIRPRLEEAEQYRKRDPGYAYVWSGGTIDLWFRARMTEENRYPSGGRYPEDIRLAVDLHVGFLHLEETEEMLALLRRERDKKTEGAPKLATPGIERTEVRVQPVDATAARVAPVEPVG